MREHLKEIVEALVFISVEPLTVAKIKSVVEDAADEDLKRVLDEIKAQYEAPEHGIRLIVTAGGYQFATKSEYDQEVRRLLQIERKSRLSRAALETLSIVAYHQPVTQAEVNALRNVADSTFTLHTLLQKKLIKISGRKKAPGNPLLYKTSEDFLIYFGLNDLSELPSQEEIAKLLEEQESHNDAAAAIDSAIGNMGESGVGVAVGGETGAGETESAPSVEGEGGETRGEIEGPASGTGESGADTGGSAESSPDTKASGVVDDEDREEEEEEEEFDDEDDDDDDEELDDDDEGDDDEGAKA